MSINESFIVFVCFGRIISQNLFRNFTFEIINYFKCRSNGSSRPHLNQMLEFSLNRPTTSTYICVTGSIAELLFVEREDLPVTHRDGLSFYKSLLQLKRGMN